MLGQARKEGRSTSSGLTDDLKLKQLHELLKVHLTAAEGRTRRRSTSSRRKRRAATCCASRSCCAKASIPNSPGAWCAVKDSKLVQVAIQGNELRVSAKNRDDLQAAIAVAAAQIEQPPC